MCITCCNSQQFCVLLTKCICRFHMILSVNSDYFLKQHQLTVLCNGYGLCFLCGTYWIFKYYLDELRLQRVNLIFGGPLYWLWWTSLSWTDESIVHERIWCQRVPFCCGFYRQRSRKAKLRVMDRPEFPGGGWGVEPSDSLALVRAHPPPPKSVNVTWIFSFVFLEHNSFLLQMSQVFSYIYSVPSSAFSSLVLLISCSSLY
jgi:hypothetical protein